MSDRRRNSVVGAASVAYSAGSSNDIMSPLGVIEHRLQSLTQRRRDARNPTFIDESDSDQIANVYAILVAEGGQFHPHECIERCQTKVRRDFRLFDTGARKLVVQPHSLVGEYDVNRVSRLGVGPELEAALQYL